LAEALGDSLIVFFAITSPTFGKAQSIPRLLDDFKGGFMSLHQTSKLEKAEEGGQVHKASQELFKKLFSSFGTDQLVVLHGKVEEVKTIAQANVRQAIINVEDASKLEDKTIQLADSSKQFADKSKQTRRMMKCRNYKVTALIVGVVLIVLVIIIIAIAVPASPK